MKRTLLSILAILIISLFSCEKDGNILLLAPDCKKLAQGLIEYDEQKAQIEISKLTADLFPSPSHEDEFGHKNNLHILVTSMNLCDNLAAEFNCYACIKTLPPQTEITVLVDSSGVSLPRILDFHTPTDTALEFIRIHSR